MQLTVTAKGQVTLRQSVLQHLGVRPGDKIEISLLPGGRIEAVSGVAPHDIRTVRSRLQRAGRAPVSLEAMQDAIEAGAAA